MKKRVVIIGGYGNFGKIIARRLGQNPNIDLVIAGRSLSKARDFAKSLPEAETAQLDVESTSFADSLAALNPFLVIHTSGPFQGQGYAVAEACIACKSHYVDLADGRDFVGQFSTLDAKAKAAGVLLVTGASSVPCLTAAIIDHYKGEFSDLRSLDYAISTAQHTNPGLATTEAICGYAGKAFKTLQGGQSVSVYGWQDLQREVYPEIGGRWLANCDVPDLSLFPERYPTLRHIRFRAGLEVPLLHFGLALMASLVRWGAVMSLSSFAPLLYKLADYFDFMGSDRSAFHMHLRGLDTAGRAYVRSIYLITASGHGPHIPCVPSILLAERLTMRDNKLAPVLPTGAQPCIDLITLDEYLAALKPLDIKWIAPEPV